MKTSLSSFLLAGLAPLLAAGAAEAGSTEHRRLHAVSPEQIEQQATASDLIDQPLDGADGEALGRIVDLALLGAVAGGEQSTDAAGALQVIVELEATDEADGEERQLVTVPLAAIQVTGSGDTIRTGLTRDQLEQQLQGDGATNANRTGAAISESGQVAPFAAAPVDEADQIEPVAVAAVPGSNLEVATTGEDVTQLEQALRDDDNLQDIAADISVMSSDEAIILTGEVDDESQKEQLVSFVEEHTDKEVRDLTVVRAAE